ncbi:ABC transporter substrate-binding protein [Corynebacterium sp. H128]|uniref:ABC transporter substrate-binding protein n=1 Tax=Corynebacterium sp. H128 TaxID=3133427 RepID=UPI0030B4BE2E
MIKSALCATAALVLTACSTTHTEAEGGALVFEHPTLEGVSVNFEKQPEKVVMDCYTYSSLADYQLKPLALYGYDCDNKNVMGDLDISEFEIIGQSAELNVERLAELRPDAIVGHGNEKGASWLDDDVKNQVSRVAPFIALPSAPTVDEDIQATRELAQFLGGEVDSEQIKKDDRDFAAAKETFKQAMSAKNLNVALVSPTKETLYTAVGFKQAKLLAENGVTIVGPEKPATGNPWGKVAWEDASTLQADLLLSESYNPAEPFRAELWDSLPAVKENQVLGWSSKGQQTSGYYAQWLNELAATAGSYKKLS